MYKLVFSLALSLVLGTQAVQAQKAPNTTTPKSPASGGNLTKADLLALKKGAYNNSLRYLDYGTATQNVVDILTISPDAVEWKDTLCLLYFNRQMYPQTLLLTDELLKAKPQDAKALEMQAIAYDALGGHKQALEAYEKLYVISKDINHLYQVAGHQFDLARIGECNQTLDAIMKSPEAEKATVSLNFGRNEQQTVPMKAAIYNMRGVIAQSLKQEAAAKQNFEEALKVYPDFVLAKGNLEALTQQPEDPNKLNYLPEPPGKPK